MIIKTEAYQWKVDNGTVTLKVTVHSSVCLELPKGYVSTLSDMPLHEFPMPVKINDEYQWFAIYEHDFPALYNMRTYKKWYRKDVLVTGLDKDSNRVRVKMDREGNLKELPK